MKNSSIFGLMPVALILTLTLTLIPTESAAKSRKAIYRVSFPSRDNAVVIRNLPDWVEGATVWCEGKEVASQLDDLDEDGRYDELCFLYRDLPAQFRGEAAGESAVTADFEVRYSSKPVEHNYPSEVNAQMWLKNEDKSLKEVREAASLKDDMYRKLHHHGPAFESAKAAYRVYFDKKQSIDTYGKKEPRLELRATNWYTTDEQLAENYGHDNIRVFGSISVGVLKGWDKRKQRMAHITEMRRREAKIRASGPVRTVVDMRVEGWRYEGREIDMTSRYILYAGHEDVQVENHLTGDLEGLVFTTGVMKIERGFTLTEQDSVLLSVGENFPENDTVRWERERVALGVAVPGRQIVSRTDDNLSHLVQLRADEQGRIDCRLWMWWQKSEWLQGEDFHSPEGLRRMGGWRYGLLKPRIEQIR